MRTLRGNPWVILIILSAGFFMVLLDLTIVNIAIPNMVDELDASLDQILWVVNSYTLALAVLLITAGRLGDLRGKKNLFIAGVALFTLASLACGLAQDPAQLITFRIVQGVGAALLLPQTLSIIVDTFPAERRGVALGVWGATAGVSGIAGPSVGGLLVTHLDWRWIFFINIPVGVLVLVMAVAVLPGTQRTLKHKLDITGVLIASAVLFCLSFALIEGQRYSWNAWIWALIGAAGVLLVIFLVHQRGQQDNEPLVPFVLFKDRNFSIMNFVGMASAFGVIGLLLPITIYLQSVLGFSPLKAGLVLIPLALGAMTMAGPAGALSDRLGGKFIVVGGLVAYAAGIAWIMAIADVGTSWTAFLIPLFIIGLGAGCTFTPIATELMRNVPLQLTGAASGVNGALRQVGSVLAGAVIGAVLQNQLATALRDQAELRAGAVPAPYREGFVAGFADAGKHGLDVGANQSGTAQQLPDGVPQDLAQSIFGHGFIDAMQPTMIASIAVLLAGAVACLAVKSHRGPSANPHDLPVSEAPEPAAALPSER
ncbi:MFS transporter [Actinomadura sp. HBU206391]|uniref:MFS transporter n=1 Tax=Actinomadura sp. HBU206391 TaxID=2731692 RepID=UPI00164F813A|nr:MFS transporter [Actinomadura sp. HBU206391]MBC6456911.1 MFS transporter [Actinomadura sp. HBU206391]